MCRAVCERIKAAPAMNAFQLSICEMAKIPTLGMVCVSDEDAMAAAGVTNRAMGAIRRALFSEHRARKYYRAHPFVPRIDPEDLSLRSTYEYIQALPAIAGQHFAFGSGLSRVRQKVRALSRCGSVEVKSALGFYRADLIDPSYQAIEGAHADALAKLHALTRMVEQAPEMTIENLLHAHEA